MLKTGLSKIQIFLHNLGFSKNSSSLSADETSSTHDQLKACRRSLEKLQNFQFVPPGHFYSPIVNPSSKSIDSGLQLSEVQPAGIDFQLERQKEMLLSDEFKSIYSDLPFPEHKSNQYRFFYQNPAYSYSDAITLFFMLRKFKPTRVIEVGSGYSSALMLDTFDLFFPGNPSVTFIEPYPQLLRSLFRPADHSKCKVIESDLQEISLQTFRTLQAKDILFIDSTHVAKAGSDVNYILSKILPSLNVGVIIHIHDIFSRFEYPLGWIKEGRNWNELYMVRSFLQFNSSFEVIFFDELLGLHCRDILAANYPLMLNNIGGSLWIRKTA